MGILRFILAISVLAAHAEPVGFNLPKGSPYNIWAMMHIDGRNAVALFFIISGFYMALVLNTKYNNIFTFYKNRFLRLWPTYIFVLILCFIFNNAFEDLNNKTTGFNALTKFYIWFSNIFIIGTDTFWLVNFNVDSSISYLPSFINQNSNGYTFLINSPSFSISIEMIFYLIAPFILKSLKRIWIFFFIGVAYNIYVVLSGNINIIYQYHLFPSSFIYFALGALAYKYSTFSDFNLTNKKVLIVFLLVFSLMFVYTLFPMIILLCFSFMLPKLFEITKNNKLDRLIGELSYPIYIVYFPILIYLQSHKIFVDNTGIACLIISILFGLLIHFVIEKKVDKLRLYLSSKN